MHQSSNFFKSANSQNILDIPQRFQSQSKTIPTISRNDINFRKTDQNIRICSYCICSILLLIIITLAAVLTKRDKNLNQIKISNFQSSIYSTCQQDRYVNLKIYQPFIIIYDYIFNLQISQTVLCVRQCPTINTTLSTFRNGSIIQTDYVFVEIDAIRDESIRYQRLYESQTVLNRICIPKLQYFKNKTIDIQLFIEGRNQTIRANDDLITNFIKDPLTNFYIDFSYNIEYIIYAVIVAVLINLLVFKAISKCFSFIFVLSQLITHSSLIGIALLFYYNGGKLNNSAFDAPYLGLPTFKFSAHYLNYATYIFIILGLWLVCNIYMFYLRFRITLGMQMLFLFTNKINYNYLPNALLSLFLGMLMILAIYISSLFASQYSIYIPFTIFKPVKSLTIQNIIYLIACYFLLVYLANINESIWKCLYYQNTYCQQPFKSFLLKSKYHMSRIVIKSFIFPFSLLFKAFIVIQQKINKLYINQEQNEQKCCTTIQIRKFFNYLLYSDRQIQIYISNSNLIQAQQQNIRLFWKYQNYYSYMKQLTLVFYALRFATALLITFQFYVVITYAMSIRLHFISPHYQLLVVFIISFYISGPFASYYQSALNSLLYAYAQYKQRPYQFKLHPEVHQLISQTFADIQKAEA